MKFALRDDDLNYFFNPEVIEKNYSNIWNICPVSMSVVPFIKGNWPVNVKEAEDRGPGKLDASVLKKLVEDDEVYPIGRNQELIQFIKEKIKEKKIYLTIHGIYHRNEDPVIPQFANNFGFGAEFYTTRNLTNQLKEAKEYVEKTFDQSVDVFTPPQNLYNIKGLTAIMNNKLAICSDLPSIKSLSTLKLIGIENYMRFFLFKLYNRDLQFPFPIIYDKFKIIGHHRLQPGTDMKKLYADFESVRNKNGIFVLSTHSYGFDFKMKNTDLRMGDALKELINYAKNISGIEFVKLVDCF